MGFSNPTFAMTAAGAAGLSTQLAARKRKPGESMSEFAQAVGQAVPRGTQPIVSPAPTSRAALMPASAQPIRAGTQDGVPALGTPTPPALPDTISAARQAANRMRRTARGGITPPPTIATGARVATPVTRPKTLGGY